MLTHAEQVDQNQTSHGTGLKLPAGMRFYTSKASMSPDRIQLLEEMAFQHGRYYDSYLITEPDREYLFSSEDYGVVAFSRKGRYLTVAGGFICGEYHRPEFVAEIVEFVRLNRLVISFLSIDETDASLFREFGFQISRWGVESRIALDGHEWKGKPYEWVRRQSNFVTRQSVSFEEWNSDFDSLPLSQARYKELKEVSDEHIAGKPHQGEIPFLEGRLLRGELYRRRIFVAINSERDDRVEGFVVCNPLQQGECWSIEMYRQRRDAPRGTIPFLFKQVIDQLQAEGCREVSLCAVPTIGAQRKLPGSAFVVRLCLYLWNRFGASVFDCRGIYHYKSRFRPVFSDVYIGAYPRSSCGAVWAYVKSSEVFHLRWGEVLKRSFSLKRLKNSLADPQKQISQI